MTREQAWDVLGLPPGSSPEAIRAAHRRLMKLAHPDQGGSTWLAAQVNRAKDVLLGS
jgi:curved DNA-binding protein CbpA